MQPDEWTAQLQKRIAAVKQENTRLRTELQDCQRSLLSQAGVAELERAALLQAELAEEAQQAAIAKEQEKAAQERVTELVKANAALRQFLLALANKPELDQFLGHVLRAVVEQMGEEAGGIWLYDAATETIAIFVRIVYT